MKQITQKAAQQIIELPIWRYEIAENGCWNWTGYVSPHGYGVVWVKRANIEGCFSNKYLAHRIAYVAARTEIPDLVVHHKCNNRRCVNPEHLVALTSGENTMADYSQSIQRKNKDKTHCPKGHALIDGNLDPSNLKRGMRYCIICRNANNARYRRKHLNSGGRVSAQHITALD